jgi:hypothetical protein
MRLVRDSLDPKAAAAELRFDTNKTALGELTERPGSRSGRRPLRRSGSAKE